MLKYGYMYLQNKKLIFRVLYKTLKFWQLKLDFLYVFSNKFFIYNFHTVFC